MNRYIILLLVTFLLSSSHSYAEIIKVFQFTNDELENLKVRKVRGADNKTKYSIGNENEMNFLKAHADNAASGLGKEVNKN